MDRFDFDSVRAPPPEIVVYADGMATIHDLMMSLRETFAGTPVTIREVHRDEFLAGDCLNEGTLAFILPGTPGGSSAYRDQLGAEGFARIDDYVRRGGCYLGICAGAYLATREFSYFNKYTDEMREIESPLPFFEGKSTGPITQYVDLREKKNPWADYSVVRIAFTNAAGKPDEGWVCYSCGPALELDENAAHKYDVIARYPDVPGQPIAIAARRIGKGQALFTGVVPEIGGARMFQQINPLSPYYADAQRFVAALFDKEESRRRIWDTLIDRILANAAENGRPVVRPFPIPDIQPFEGAAPC